MMMGLLSGRMVWMLVWMMVMWSFRKAHAFVASSPPLQGRMSAFILPSQSTTYERDLELSKEDGAIGYVARSAAILAGKALLSGLGSIDLSYGVESKIGSRDIVTKVDKEAQEIIKETIQKAFPNHRFLGEEDVPPGIEASKGM